MLNRNQAVVLLSAIALLTLFVGAASADDGQAALVGSWDGFSVLDGETDVTPSLFTYNAGGTFTGTGPSLFNGNAHGAWKQTGSRTFETTNVSFIYGLAGQVIGRFEVDTVVTVAADGQSYDAVFSGEARFDDGSVDAFSGTAVATRIGDGDDGDSDSDSD